MANSHIELTIGALLAGGMLAVALSAILGFQTFLYFAFFKNDQSRYKLFVVWIWLADTVQTAMICTAMWQYNVVNFLHMDATARIVPALAVNIAMTATITFSANVFYTWRIHRLSDKNWWFTGPITLLSVTRTCMGFAVAIDMILSQTFSKFTREHGHIILLSTQAVSSFTEIVISLARYYYLRRIRRGATIPHEAVDTIVIFTVNDGCLQSAVILVVMICFLAIPNSFVFLAVQFAVAKIASNSMLATLNLRKWFRHRHHLQPERTLQLATRNRRHTNRSESDPSSPRSPIGSPSMKHADDRDSLDGGLATRLQVFVEHRMQVVEDDLPPKGDAERGTSELGCAM